MSQQARYMPDFGWGESEGHFHAAAPFTCSGQKSVLGFVACFVRCNSHIGLSHLGKSQSATDIRPQIRPIFGSSFSNRGLAQRSPEDRRPVLMCAIASSPGAPYRYQPLMPPHLSPFLILWRAPEVHSPTAGMPDRDGILRVESAGLHSRLSPVDRRFDEGELGS